MANNRALYGGAITDAIASSDLDNLRKLEAEAEAHLKKYGDVPTLLSLLKLEIAKLQGRSAS